jgi:hypothetical protein
MARRTGGGGEVFDLPDGYQGGRVLIDDIPLEAFIAWYGRAEAERRLARGGLILGPAFDGWDP